jgi:predicted TIM-barrel fold metal-dependent hydrolase
MERRHFLLGAASASLAGAAMAQPAPAKRTIVDAQIHMWRPNSPEKPWAPGTRPQIWEPMSIERVIAIIDDAGVERVVIVPPTLEGERYDYGQEAARRYPGRFATMGHVRLEDPNEAKRLATWREQPALLGVRLNIVGEQEAWLRDGTADWFWDAAQKYNVPVMFLTRGQLALFGPIAERFPGLSLIIDHMGVSSDALKEGLMPETIKTAAALAKYPNVAVKLSSTPLLSKEPYPWHDMDDNIHRLFDAYGPKRCFWGTDVTNSYIKASYRQRVTHFTEELKFFTQDDLDWVMGRAILERLRWT